MNANLLADILDVEWDRNGRKSFIAEAATMLRQQQTEIETLKSDMRMLLKEYYEYCVKKK